ncbi:PIN domain-containing protein [Candidatus Peregrinibacteria bacterium]|nr:PIN domain-containing protein [Candidatus Peregrinibacteria bacterium]
MVKKFGWKKYFKNCSCVSLDTSILIYLLQDDEKYSDIVDRIFQFFESKKINLSFSSILLAELLVYPFRNGQTDIAKDWLSYFKIEKNLEIVDLNPVIAVDAAYLRAKYNIKTPDSIHLATAMQKENAIFLTNDLDLKKIQEVKVICISNFN